MPTQAKAQRPAEAAGRLKIGDDWNAIHIIALSQSNPLKAVAEFVENAIDARARKITIIRGKERGASYLRIIDDGEGLPRDEEGRPNFKYVATHICDSLKRQMKVQGQQGIQGEFGIGLLSFWTVGETLSLISAGSDGHAYEMRMAKGDPNYSVSRLRRLTPLTGTELTIQPLLPGIRQFSGEKLQWYLASELRDRIRNSGVAIKILDRQARAEFEVQPREFSGQRLHPLPNISTPLGDVFVELYLAEPGAGNVVSLYRSGTRVLENVAELAGMAHEPWTSGALQGAIDAPFLTLSPGSRLGVIHDERLAAFLSALGELETQLIETIQEQRQASEEKTNRETLQSIQRAFREALSALPQEEYDWFEGYGVKDKRGKRPSVPDGATGDAAGTSVASDDRSAEGEERPPGSQKEFFEHPGPLHAVRISPASSVISVNATRQLRAVARDRAGRQIEGDMELTWRVVEGAATLSTQTGEIIQLTAPAEPQLVRIAVSARQGETTAEAEAMLTITDSLLPERPKSEAQKGLPEYTFEKRAGELWRSRYDLARNVIVINNGHRDFVYATRAGRNKLRYLCRLFAKEMVLHNFPGYTPEQLLERMIELSLYTEDKLR